LRAILESARGVKPDDKSEPAQESRRVASYDDFNGLHFIARIGIEPARNGYKAKNTLAEVITPDRRDWHPIERVGEQPAVAPTTDRPEPVKIGRPQWAK
jgi:hypothetical protein